MSMTADKLYQLLPAIYRLRDSEFGEQLKALVTVLAEQASVVEQDINQLYKNWFIETCDEWVVPYIGDLLGVQDLHSFGTDTSFSQRGRVANTLAYRRRKGTATVLEQLAFDTTGWRARAVEFFDLLGTTQHFNHVRLHNVRTPDIRETDQLELLNTAFDRIPHTADVRTIVADLGRHNIPNVGLFVWRIQNYAVTRSTACEASGAPSGSYYFNPSGTNMPLFNPPQTETEITHLAEEQNVPGLLRRRPLYAELEALRNGGSEGLVYFSETGQGSSVFEIFLNGESDPIRPEEIEICNLENWRIPDGPIKAAVDPVLGRMTFSSLVTINESPRVSFSYGFSGDVGCGTYNRREYITENLLRPVTWQAGVSKEMPSVPNQIYDNLSDALTAWETQVAGTVGVISIMDSSTYEETLSVNMPEGSLLLIVGSGWPERNIDGLDQRVTGDLDPDGLRPHVRGDVIVTGTAAGSTPGDLWIDGVLIEGRLNVQSNLGTLHLSHTTLVPSTEGGIVVEGSNEQLTIILARSICGPILIPGPITLLSLEESIVDNGSGAAIDAQETSVKAEKCTVLGTTLVLSIEAGNSVFPQEIQSKRTQIGCVRYSYLHPDSSVPRRYRCQPDMAASGMDAAEIPAIQARLVPMFTSEDYAHYGYAQLKTSCPEEIRTGADDGSEMGVFSFLKQPQREANLRASLDEYLRFGLEAGIIHVT